jgi:hypothetical protein
LDSGLTQAAFCKQEGLSPNVFSFWKSELIRRDAKASDAAATAQDLFVPVANVAATVEQRTAKSTFV